jgi:hypothetical protein
MADIQSHFETRTSSFKAVILLYLEIVTANMKVSPSMRQFSHILKLFVLSCENIPEKNYSKQGAKRMKTSKNQEIWRRNRAMKKLELILIENDSCFIL